VRNEAVCKPSPAAAMLSLQNGLFCIRELTKAECAGDAHSECLFVSRGKGIVIGRRLVARPGSGLPEEPVAGV
jgi:hypothetical protein